VVRVERVVKKAIRADKAAERVAVRKAAPVAVRKVAKVVRGAAKADPVAAKADRVGRRVGEAVKADRVGRRVGEAVKVARVPGSPNGRDAAAGKARARTRLNHETLSFAIIARLLVPLQSPIRVAILALLVGGLACAKNSANEQVRADRDSTGAGTADSANPNQSKSGVTDTKTGKSTLGPGATKTRPDQGQPVTSKGDTINTSVDSSTSPRGDSASAPR
jgi:hypothetical protein